MTVIIRTCLCFDSKIVVYTYDVVVTMCGMCFGLGLTTWVVVNCIEVDIFAREESPWSEGTACTYRPFPQARSH